MDINLEPADPKCTARLIVDAEYGPRLDISFPKYWLAGYYRREMTDSEKINDVVRVHLCLKDL